MRSRVYLWLAHMAQAEADTLAYAYPRAADWLDGYCEWMEVADRCADLALVGLDREQRDAAWRDAMDAWEASS